MFEVTDLKIGEHQLIGDIIGESFADDPVNSWVFGPRESISRYYSLLAKKLYLPQGFGHVDSQSVAGSLWLPPGTKKEIPLFRSLDIAVSMIRYGSFKSIYRGLALENALSKKVPVEPHFFLFAIGTRPDEQGENIAFYRRFGFEVMEKIIPAEGSPPMWLMWREAR